MAKHFNSGCSNHFHQGVSSSILTGRLISHFNRLSIVLNLEGGGVNKRGVINISTGGGGLTSAKSSRGNSPFRLTKSRFLRFLYLLTGAFLGIGSIQQSEARDVHFPSIPTSRIFEHVSLIIFVDHSGYSHNMCTYKANLNQSIHPSICFIHSVHQNYTAQHIVHV